MKWLLAVGLVVFIQSISLLAVDEQVALPNGDPCKSATPKPGCLKIVTPPRLLSPIRPDCSAGVCKKKHGVVVLRAVISDSGQLKEISFVSGDGKLREVALNTVRQWHYRPAMINGVPIDVTHDITMDFIKKDGVLMGADDLSLDVPTEPSEEILAKLRAGDVSRVGKSYNSAQVVTAPKALYSPDPEYSSQARKHNVQGTCVLGVIVGPDGNPSSVGVVRPLGYGLDERAFQTVRRWKFAPARREGDPVEVMINVEVQFRLY
jgi:TonB family protein